MLSRIHLPVLASHPYNSIELCAEDLSRSWPFACLVPQRCRRRDQKESLGPGISKTMTKIVSDESPSLSPSSATTLGDHRSIKCWTMSVRAREHQRDFCNRDTHELGRSIANKSRDNQVIINCWNAV